MTGAEVLCTNCGQPIREEPIEGFSPFWVHVEEGNVVCDIEWAHPSLPVEDNAITRVEIARPPKASDTQA